MMGLLPTSMDSKSHRVTRQPLQAGIQRPRLNIPPRLRRVTTRPSWNQVQRLTGDLAKLPAQPPLTNLAPTMANMSPTLRWEKHPAPHSTAIRLFHSLVNRMFWSSPPRPTWICPVSQEADRLNYGQNGTVVVGHVTLWSRTVQRVELGVMIK